MISAEVEEMKQEYKSVLTLAKKVHIFVDTTAQSTQYFLLAASTHDQKNPLWKSMLPPPHPNYSWKYISIEQYFTLFNPTLWDLDSHYSKPKKVRMEVRDKN